MDIRITNNSCYNTNFKSSNKTISYLRNRHRQKLVKNAFEIYRDSFRSTEAEEPVFNFLQRLFFPRTIKYYDEFKKTQPFMPTTKFPSASNIKQRLSINPDQSTNIAGVYVDKDGLVILDYNRISDWDVLGFPKGTRSKGIEVKDDRLFIGHGDKMDIGNIRFFSHGLIPDERTIESFDSCTKKGSKAMLSFNYGCRSDLISFFYPIGIISHLDPVNIIGGQNSWKSYAMLEHGFKKSLDGYFKHGFVETTEGFTQRNLLANITKESGKFSDKEYPQFVRQFAEKPFQDVQPKNLQEKIMEGFANLNSYIGGYRYDEIYGIEPHPMGIFLDAKEIPASMGNLPDIVEKSMTIMPVCNENAGTSMNQSVNHLKKYAIKKDIPCLVFNYSVK